MTTDAETLPEYPKSVCWTCEHTADPDFVLWVTLESLGPARAAPGYQVTVNDGGTTVRVPVPRCRACRSWFGWRQGIIVAPCCSSSRASASRSSLGGTAASRSCHWRSATGPSGRGPKTTSHRSPHCARADGNCRHRRRIEACWFGSTCSAQNEIYVRLSGGMRLRISPEAARKPVNSETASTRASSF